MQRRRYLKKLFSLNDLPKEGVIMPELFYRILNKLIEGNIPVIRYPLRRHDNDLNPFFIVGSGRSGNTLLRRILLTHPDLYIPPETYVLGRAIRTYRDNGNMQWNDLVSLTLSIFEYHPEFVTFDCTLRPLANKLNKLPSSSRNLAFILDSFYRYHAEIKGFECSRWGDKTPLNVYDLATIRGVFPKAQFIHIVRDGCDVVESYIRSGIYSDLTSAANRWISSVSAFQKFSGRYPHSCFQVRYEDLVTDPVETIKGLCDFLKVEFEDQMLGSEDLSDLIGDVKMRPHHWRVSSEITSSWIGTGRESLTAED